MSIIDKQRTLLLDLKLELPPPIQDALKKYVALNGALKIEILRLFILLVTVELSTNIGI